METLNFELHFSNLLIKNLLETFKCSITLFRRISLCRKFLSINQHSSTFLWLILHLTNLMGGISNYHTLKERNIKPFVI